MGPVFPSYAAALDYYESYKPHTFTSRLHGGQIGDYAKLRAFVDYKIQNGEIRIEPPEADHLRRTA